MVLARHLLRLLGSTVRYTFATGKVGLLLLLVLGLVVVALAMASQAAAPFVLYPFA